MTFVTLDLGSYQYSNARRDTSNFSQSSSGRICYIILCADVSNDLFPWKNTGHRNSVNLFNFGVHFVVICNSTKKQSIIAGSMRLMSLGHTPLFIETRLVFDFPSTIKCLNLPLIWPEGMELLSFLFFYWLFQCSFNSTLVKGLDFRLLNKAKSCLSPIIHSSSFRSNVKR